MERAINPEQIIRAHLEKHPQKYAERFTEKRKETAAHLKDALSDLIKAIEMVDDGMMVGLREEAKLLLQLRSIADPNSFFAELHSIEKSLVKVYTDVARNIDAFKNKWYSDKKFIEWVIDVCQADVFTTENKSASIANREDKEHVRLRLYIQIYLNLYRTFEYYIRSLIDLMEKGPAPEIKLVLPEYLNWELPKPLDG